MRNIAFLTFCSGGVFVLCHSEVVMRSLAQPLHCEPLTLGVRSRPLNFISRVDVVTPSVAVRLVPGRLVDAPLWRLACVPDGCWLLRMRFD